MRRDGRRPPAVFALLLMAAVAGCYRPDERAGPRIAPQLVAVENGRLPAVAGMKLHVFNTGMNRVSPLLVGSPALWRPAPAFVIERPGRELVVFDCGVGTEIARESEGALNPLTRLLFKTRSLPGKDLPAQMREAGLPPERVSHVILSHQHFDHVGSAEGFASASFIAGPQARESSRSRINGFEPAHTDWISDAAWFEVDFSKGEPYATFDRTIDLFGDRSVVLIKGGGHTPDGLGALLALANGPVLLAADLAVHFDWLRGDDVQRIVSDGDRAAEVRNRIREFMRLVPAAVVMPGHDLSQVPAGRDDIVRHHPELFLPQAWPIDSE